MGGTVVHTGAANLYIDATAAKFGAAGLIRANNANAGLVAVTSPAVADLFKKIDANSEFTIEFFFNDALTAAANAVGEFLRIGDFNVRRRRNASTSFYVDVLDGSTILYTTYRSARRQSHLLINKRAGVSSATFHIDGGSSLFSIPIVNGLDSMEGVDLVNVMRRSASATVASSETFDELRISATARYSGGSYTVPTAQFVPD